MLIRWQRVSPHSVEFDLLAVVTLQGRLLIFPVADLLALARGKGNKLIQIPPATRKVQIRRYSVQFQV